MFDEDILKLFKLFRLDFDNFDFSEFLVRYNLILEKLYEIFQRNAAEVNIHFFSSVIQNVSKYLKNCFEVDDVSPEDIQEYIPSYFFDLQKKSEEQYNVVDLNFVYCFLITNIIMDNDLGEFYGSLGYEMFEIAYQLSQLLYSFENTYSKDMSKRN